MKKVLEAGAFGGGGHIKDQGKGVQEQPFC